MRALIRVGLVSSLALATAAAASSSSNRRTETRSVGEFDAVAVHAGIHCVVSTGERSVEVTAEPETLNKVVIEVVDGVLEIGFQQNVWRLFGGSWRSGEVQVRVRTPRLRALEASGGA